MQRLFIVINMYHRGGNLWFIPIKVIYNLLYVYVYITGLEIHLWLFIISMVYTIELVWSIELSPLNIILWYEWSTPAPY